MRQEAQQLPRNHSSEAELLRNIQGEPKSLPLYITTINNRDMGLSRELIEGLDDLHLQYTFTQILVLYGVLYAEMKKRDLLVNPKK